MMRLRYVAITFSILFLMAGCIQSSNKTHKSIEWLDYNEGLQKMENTGKPAMLYFCSPGYDFCETLEKNLFSNETIIDMMKDFVAIKIDVNDPSQGEILSKYKFMNNPFPLVVFLDGNGNELSKLVAYGIYNPSDKIESIKRFIEVLNLTLQGKIKGEDFRFVTLSGEEKRLSDYRGKVVILDLMSVNCPACRAQMNYLSEIRDYYHNDTDVVIISLDVAGDDVSSIESTYGSYINNWIFGIDKYYEASKYLLENAIPTIVIFDKYGRIFYLKAGLKTTQSLIDLIENVKD